MKILLDIDGTIVEHAYPKLGRANFGAVEVIRKLQDAGHEIIWNSYRADMANGSLENAINWFNNLAWATLKSSEKWKDDTLHPLPITAYTAKKIHPQQWAWDLMHMTGEIHIDDCAAGIPMKPQVMLSNGNMVDWDLIDLEFQANGIY